MLYRCPQRPAGGVEFPLELDLNQNMGAENRLQVLCGSSACSCSPPLNRFSNLHEVLLSCFRKTANASCLPCLPPGAYTEKSGPARGTSPLHL